MGHPGIDHVPELPQPDNDKDVMIMYVALLNAKEMERSFPNYYFPIITCTHSSDLPFSPDNGLY